MKTGTGKLAIDGGKPARCKPLPPNYPGALMMGEEEASRAAEVIRARSPFRFYGPDVRGTGFELEEMMEKTLGMPYVLGVTSGTAALMVAMKALGIGYGDKVVCPAVTFLATATAIVCCNAVPVFADVDDSLNMDAKDLERVVDDEVRAIIVVPIVGVPVNMDPIMEFASRRNIAVIEDVAQSCGVRYKGRYAGTIGDVGTYSFQMNKILTAGEGGAVATRRLDVFDRAIRFHDQGLVRAGFRERYGITSTDDTAAFAGQNYRMSEITAAVLAEQWRKMPALLASTRANYDRLRDGLRAQIPSIVFRGSPDPAGDIGCTLGIVLPSAEAAQRFNAATAAENIGTFLLYGGKPVFTNPCFMHKRSADRGPFPWDFPFKNPVEYRVGMCPTAENLTPRTTFLPVSHSLTNADVAEIVDGLAKVWRGLEIG